MTYMPPHFECQLDRLATLGVSMHYYINDAYPICTQAADDIWHCARSRLWQKSYANWIEKWSVLAGDASNIIPWRQIICIEAECMCIGNLIIIGLDNDLSPSRRQAIIWTSAGLFIISWTLGNSEISTEMLASSFKKMRLKASSAKQRPFCLATLDWAMVWCRLATTHYPILC